MPFFAKLDRHTDLINRMAATTGASFAEALFKGRLDGQQLRGAVLNCCACQEAEACADWLAAHDAGAQDAPGYCRNLPLLARLRN